MWNLLKCQAFYRSPPRQLPLQTLGERRRECERERVRGNFYLRVLHFLFSPPTPPYPVAWPMFNYCLFWLALAASKWTAIYKNALSCSLDNKYEFESVACGPVSAPVVVVVVVAVATLGLLHPHPLAATRV